MKKFQCICCNIDINILHPEYHIEPKDKPENWMWDGGIVGRIDAGYGSILDGNVYYLAICDGCIKKKEEERVLIYSHNYMQGNESN